MRVKMILARVVGPLRMETRLQLISLSNLLHRLIKKKSNKVKNLKGRKYLQ
jgi:hypothetical protein